MNSGKSERQSAGGQGVASNAPPDQDDGKRWSFIGGQTAVIPDTIDGKCIPNDQEIGFI
jgi:hypothetical protein